MTSILCVIPKGAGGNDELRARRLMDGFDADVSYHVVDRKLSYPASIKLLWKSVTSKPWDLIYAEGTGIIAGGNLILASLSRKQRYIVSGGDPVGGFFAVTKGPVAGSFFRFYEKLLYQASAGFVGWTPYLTGLAMHLGAPRGVTVEGSVATDVFRSYSVEERAVAKKRFGLDPGHLVLGVAGSLKWTPRQQYSYGLELVETIKLLKRRDVSAMIVGDGDGRAELERRVPADLKQRVVFTGRISEMDVVDALNAMNIGFITQTLDELGSYRLTTKLPEYLSTGLPVAMSPIPGFFDYVGEAGWSLPAHHPATREFHSECATWIDGLSWDEVRLRASKTRDIAAARFDYSTTRPRFQAFIGSLCNQST